MRRYVREWNEIWKKQFSRVEWPVMGKQNIQAKKVYTE